MAQDATIIGRTLAGKFRVTGVIGEGGMATVYRAVQEVEPKDVAIKVMNPELAKDSRFVRRFRREAKAAAMLKHPNTVSILEFGVDQGFVYLAMECVDGSDLALLLHRERRVTERRAAHIVMQVCKALSAAHELSIVHRDLKPDNIMIVKRNGDADHVKVLDFGIAKILDEDESKTGGDPRAEPITAAKSMLTRVGTIVGTPAYMAPEQGRAEAVDGRTDVYACGVLLYELVTGRVPFSGETPMQVVMRHVNEAPQPPSTFLPIHPDLEAIILRSLSKWPAERQQSAAELAGALGALSPHLSDAKRQVGEAAPGKVIIEQAAKPLPPPRAAEIAEGSTLVMEPPKAPPPPKPATAPGAAPITLAAPSFPTLNIDVPEDILAGIEASVIANLPPPPAPQPLAAAPARPKLPPAAFPPLPAPKPGAPEPIEPDTDSDDVRTLIAREAPVPQGPPPVVADADDDPRTVIAPPRGASIPDLSQPIAFSGVVAGDGLPVALSAPVQRIPTGPHRPQAVPPPSALTAMAPANPDAATTLVSALTDPDPTTAQAKSSGPKPLGTTALAALKGTAKMDPVSIPVTLNAASTLVPSTQPSAGASIALDATQRVDVSPLAGKPDPRAQPGPAAGAPADAPPPSVEVMLEEASVDLEAPNRSSNVALAPAAAPLPAAALAPAPAAPIVWQPQQRKRLSGPVAMGLGILIGAILFGLTLLILRRGL